MPQKQILVVDDNAPAADSLVKLLTLMGWSATGLYSAKSAIEYLERAEADIILLDIGMPEMNGYELAHYLRRQCLLEVPIIAVSGFGMDEDKRKAYEAGFTLHLTKPVNRLQLSKALEDVTA